MSTNVVKVVLVDLVLALALVSLPEARGSGSESATYGVRLTGSLAWGEGGRGGESHCGGRP